MQKPVKLYNLIWMLNGKQKEVILTNKPYAVCKWEQRKRENTTHKTGKLIILQNT